jgi:hypothetical protein
MRSGKNKEFLRCITASCFELIITPLDANFMTAKKSDLIRISGAMRPSPKRSPHVWVNSFANKQACRTLAPSEANWPVGRTGRSTDAPLVFSGYFPMPFQRIENWK